MADKEWSTNYPSSQDTLSSDQPDLDNGDRGLPSQIHTLRDKLDEVANEVGDNSNLPAGSLRDRVSENESDISSLESAVSDLETADEDSFHESTTGEIAGLTEKTDPVAADKVLLEDSAASNAKKMAQLSNLGKAIKLDDLASPDDNTDLNTSTSAHGLCPKLDNNAAHYFDGTGSWSTPDIGYGEHLHLIVRYDTESNPATGSSFISWVDERFVIDADYIPTKWVYHVSAYVYPPGGDGMGTPEDTCQFRISIGSDTATQNFTSDSETLFIGEISPITESGDSLIDFNVDIRNVDATGDSGYVKYIAIYAVY